MTLWLKSRRIELIGAAILVQAALLLIAGGTLLPVPSIVQGAIGKVPATVFIPLALSTMLSHCLVADELEATAIRRTAWRDAGLVLASCAIVVALAAIAHLLGAALALESARNTAGYIGIALLVGAVAGPRLGAIAPTAFVLLLSLSSTNNDAHLAAWRWPLRTAGSVSAAGVAAALLGLGIAALLIGRTTPLLQRLRRAW